MRLLIAIVSLAVVASLGLAGEAAAQAPVKIGFLAPLSGAIAQAGKDMYSGCELYWQESGWQSTPRTATRARGSSRRRSRPSAARWRIGRR